jgi:excisionase family DNA binding protein
MEPLLLTEREACERLSLGRSTLRRLWAEGHLQPLKIGRSLRFASAEIERFVLELQAQAQAER